MCRTVTRSPDCCWVYCGRASGFWTVLFSCVPNTAEDGLFSMVNTSDHWLSVGLLSVTSALDIAVPTEFGGSWQPPTKASLSFASSRTPLDVMRLCGCETVSFVNVPSRLKLNRFIPLSDRVCRPYLFELSRLLGNLNVPSCRWTHATDPSAKPNRLP